MKTTELDLAKETIAALRVEVARLQSELQTERILVNEFGDAVGPEKTKAIIRRVAKTLAKARAK